MKNCFLTISIILLLATSAVAQQKVHKYQYAVKYVCGPMDSVGVVARGVYQTAINVHNPNRLAAGVKLYKRFDIALPLENPNGKYDSTYDPVTLLPNRALDIDCDDIRAHFSGIPPTQFITGFVIIETDYIVDVEAVYTAAPAGGGVSTMEVKLVEPRKLADLQ